MSSTWNKYKTNTNTWKWLKKSNLKGCTAALISSVQEQALRTSCMKFHIDKTGESLLCRMCRVENDTVYSLYSL